MKKVLLIALVAVMGGFAGVATAGDAAAGKAKAAMCAGCHGADGKGNAAANYPALAGKEAKFLEEQLKAFKAGTRQNPTMQAMVASLTDADMANLAAYFSGL
jgi:cytochrome c553